MEGVRALQASTMGVFQRFQNGVAADSVRVALADGGLQVVGRRHPDDVRPDRKQVVAMLQERANAAGGLLSAAMTVTAGSKQVCGPSLAKTLPRSSAAQTEHEMPIS